MRTTPSIEPTILRQVRPWGRAACDLLFVDGRITDAAPGIDDPDALIIDGGGALALPALIDAHMHLDKTLWGMPWRAHAAGPNRESRIATDREARRELVDSLEIRAASLVRQAMRAGTGAIRTHVDVEPELGLRHVEALLQVRADFIDKMDIQLIAFPQFGLIRNPGTEAVMALALQAGVEVVGGIDPSSIDGDPTGHLDVVFGLADRHGAMIDIHLHEMGEEGARSMDMICERTTALGMAGRVAISHAFCLGSVGQDRRDGLIARLADAGVAVITYAPGASPVPPLKVLREAGVVLAVGSDGVRDTWTPYGNADMLERAMMLAYRSDFRTDGDIELALDAVLSGGAAALGRPRPDLKPGCPADILLVHADTVAEAVCSRPSGRRTFKGGRLISVSGENQLQ